MAKIVLGAEHDVALTNVLLDVLREIGAKEVTRNWGMAGSQEISTIEYELGGKPLTLEAETFIGLSLTGEDSIVEAVLNQLNERKRG